jgi:hypothetical protein
LNNGGEEVLLFDPASYLIDRVVYPMTSVGVSLERIDPRASGADVLNWLGSTRGATPNQPNSVAAVEASAVDLLADPNPFETETRIQYTLPVSRAHVNLWVFDRAGRKVRTLLDVSEGGGRREITWDGRNDQQQFLKSGVFVLYLEARSPVGQVFRAKVPVVLARGLEN